MTYEQSPQTGQSIVVRGKTESPLLQRSIREAIHRVKDQIVDNMKTLEQLKHESVADERFRSSSWASSRGRAGPRRHRPLRGHLLFGPPAHARDRHPHGLGPSPAIGLVLRNGAEEVDGDGARHRNTGAPRSAWPSSSRPCCSIRGQVRSGHLSRRSPRSCLLIAALLACLLPARLGHAGGPHGGPAVRVT